jgi:nicotinamide-nucleotide amidase
MIAEIISIGNELLNGNTINTNASHIAKCLHETGIMVQQIQTVSDEESMIVGAVSLAMSRVQVVLVTGGLGPTHDDITKKSLADYFKSPLEFHEGIFQKVKSRFEKHGIKMPEINRAQALVPRDAELMENPVGTAPGMIFKKQNCYVFIMPGVPKEMQAMMDESVIPKLRQECPECRVKVDLFRTTGIAESAIYERIEKDFQSFSDFEIAFLPRFTGVDIRVIRHQSAMLNESLFQKFREILYGNIGEYIFTTEPVELEAVIGRLLTERNQTVAIAESLTGGLVQDKLTDIPGSSDYFMGGVVAYSNDAKASLLAVKSDTIMEHGAVSEAVVREMATGIQQRFNTDLGIATTGIAGPAGATETKPVGLVFVGVAYNSLVNVKKFQFSGDRQIVKQRSAQAALELARRTILKLNI